MQGNDKSSPNRKLTKSNLTFVKLIARLVCVSCPIPLRSILATYFSEPASARYIKPGDRKVGLSAMCLASFGWRRKVEHKVENSTPQVYRGS